MGGGEGGGRGGQESGLAEVDFRCESLPQLSRTVKVGVDIH